METEGALTSWHLHRRWILMVVEVKTWSSTCRTPSAAFTSRRGWAACFREKVGVGSDEVHRAALVIGPTRAPPDA